MGTDEGPYARCYDCEKGLSATELTRGIAHIEHVDQSGYERVEVPMCHACKLKRHGTPCGDCGELHENQEQAFRCCTRPHEVSDVY